MCVCARWRIGQCEGVCVRVWLWVLRHRHVLSRVYPYLSSMQRTCAILSSRPHRLFHVFLNYLINGAILVKTLLNIKSVFFYFLHDFYLNISRYKKNSARYCYKCENANFFFCTGQAVTCCENKLKFTVFLIHFYNCSLH